MNLNSSSSIPSMESPSLTWAVSSGELSSTNSTALGHRGGYVVQAGLSRFLCELCLLEQQGSHFPDWLNKDISPATC